MKELYTIGHSTLSLSDFLGILHSHGIIHLVDVRSVPKSRHVPWFNQVGLEAYLKKENISYTHLVKLGGFRKPNKNSINTGWKNSSFRGFADYMLTKNFFEGLKALNQIVRKERVAVMCSEALPWRCHRSLIADAEVIRNYQVWHILGKQSIKRHNLTSFARVDRSKRPMQIYYLTMKNN